MIESRGSSGMGGRVTMTITGGSTGLIDELEIELAHLESLWSRFLADSELSRLNAAAGKPLTVHPSTIELIRAMQRGFIETDGAFDPTLLPVLVDAGYATSFLNADRICTVPASSHPGGDLRDIVIGDTEVQLPVGMTLDSGGIGKGFAADLLAARALDAGATGAMIEIGGDLVAVGVGPRDGAWSVGVEHPDDPARHLEVVRISSGAIATSGTRRRRWTADGETRHHLLDPRTLLPPRTGLATATVIAGSGARAEILTKAAFMPPEEGFLAWLPSRNAAGLVITTEGEIRTSANWVDYR